MIAVMSEEEDPLRREADINRRGAVSPPGEQPEADKSVPTVPASGVRRLRGSLYITVN
jgi:hypothetical protein